MRETKGVAMTKNEAKQNIIAYASMQAENLPMGMGIAFDTAIKALEEVQQYHAIGTLEECRAAVEKQKPMAVVEKTMNTSIGENVGTCPVCVGVPLRQYDHPYCPDCGQKLDWKDEE